MKELKKQGKYRVLILALVLLLQVFTFMGFDTEVVDASGSNLAASDIIEKIEVLNKKDKYYPRESVIVEVEWALPDDTPEKSFSPGDSFKMKIPTNGLVPNFDHLKGGDLSEIYFEGDEIIVVFTDKIDGLINRKGGFNLEFIVERQEGEDNSTIDLEFEDENGQVINKDMSIEVDNSVGEIVGDDYLETFTKGHYVGYGGNPRWFIRVNKNRTDATNGKNLTLKDRLGENHIILIDSFEVKVNRDPHSVAVGNEIIPIEDLDITFDDDLRGFTLDLSTEESQWYNIEYNTVYVGDLSDKDDTGNIQLKNEAYLFDRDLGEIEMDNSGGNNSINYEFQAKAWSMGERGYGDFAIKKVDKLTQEVLSGVSFEAVHQEDSSIKQTVETDDHGIAVFKQLPFGTYKISEVFAKEGYLADFETEIVIGFAKEYPDSSAIDIVDLVVENDVTPIEVTFEKRWFNAKGDNINEAPTAITVQLLADGEVFRQKTLNKEDDLTFTFKNLPKRKLVDAATKEVKEIEYTIKELDVDGYRSIIKEVIQSGDNKKFIIENKEEPIDEKTDIKVRKNWFNNLENYEDNLQMAPVSDITVALYADGKKVESKKLPKDAEPYELIFEDQPKYNKFNELIEYTIKEVDKFDDFEIIVEEPVKGYEFEINNIATEPIEVHVSKEWFNHTGKIDPVENIEVNLLANGVKIATKELSKEEKDITFLGLDKYDLNGNLIEYTIEEKPLSGFEPKYIELSEGVWLIENHQSTEPVPNPAPTINLRGVKHWEDDQGNKIDSQTDIIIKLFANGVEQEDHRLTLAKGENRFEFRDLPQYDKDKNLIEYEVKEVPIEGYTKTERYDEKSDQWVITNTLVPTDPGTKDLKLVKTWKNSYGIETEPLKDVKFELYANENKIDEVTLTPQSKQEYVFEGLSLLDENGDEIVYTIKEQEDDAFKTNVEVEDNVYHFINTYDIESTDIKIIKKWKNTHGEEAIPLKDVTFDLYANGKKIKEITLSKDDKQEYVFENLPAVDEAGEEIKYHVQEREDAAFKTSVKVEGNVYYFTNTYEVSESVKASSNDFTPKIPNTGIKVTYAPYILILILALSYLIIRAYRKIKRINK